jgi:hypothetical protein
MLKRYGNQSQAILWAEQLKQKYTDQRYAYHNPCTRVHELFMELINPQRVLQIIESNEI